MPTTPPKKTNTLTKRLATTITLWTLLLLALLTPNPHTANITLTLTLTLLAATAYREHTQLIQKKTNQPLPLWTPITIGTLLILHQTQHQHLPPTLQTNTPTPHLTLLLLLLLTQTLTPNKTKTTHTTTAHTLLAWLYTYFLLTFLIKIHQHQPGTPALLLYLILTTKTADIGAYTLGTLIGKHKLTPKISPNKTWEGLIGAILAATTTSITTTQLIPNLKPLQNHHALILGPLLAITATIGDLIESQLKRQTNTKDSGNLLPGIGGCLDLLDSILFNAPIFYLYCLLTIPTK